MTETITISLKPVCLLQFTERVLDWSQEIWILLLALKLMRYVTSSILLNLTGFFFFKNYGNRLCDLWEWWQLYIESQLETTDNMMGFFFSGCKKYILPTKILTYLKSMGPVFEIRKYSGEYLRSGKSLKIRDLVLLY